MPRLYAEIRAEAARRIVGDVVQYGDVADLGGYREVFEAGAFGDVSRADVILTWQHRRDRPLARTGGGGLVLTDSPRALEMVVDMPETKDGDDALEMVRRRVFRGASVEFAALADHVSGDLRTITSAHLGGIGLVDRPAYPASTVEARRERPILMGAQWARRYVVTRDDGRRQKVHVDQAALEWSFEHITERPISLTFGALPIASTVAGLVLENNPPGVDIRVTDEAPQTTIRDDAITAWKAGLVDPQPVISIAPTAPDETVLEGIEQDTGTPLLRAPIVLRAFRLSAGHREAAKIYNANRLPDMTSSARLRRRFHVLSL